MNGEGWIIAPDCGDSGHAALYDSEGRKLALIFDEMTVSRLLRYSDEQRREASLPDIGRSI